MTFLARKRIILAKIEGTYGTDPTPAAASNAILTQNLQRTIYGGNRVTREPITPYMGSHHEINAAPFVTLTFDVELAGAAAAGTAPQYGPLLRACGLSETVVAVTSVTYAPISTGFESVTIYYNYDGEMQKIIGARGTARLSFSRGGLPMISFTFTGLYARPTAVALYTPTHTFAQPFPVNDTNTTSFIVHSDEVYGESMSLDLGVNVAFRNLIGNTSVQIVDRKPRGSVTYEAPAIATKNVYEEVESHAAAVVIDDIKIVHGTAAGNICTLTFPTAQVSTLEDSESDGIRTFTSDFIPVPTTAGNNEFSLAFT